MVDRWSFDDLRNSCCLLLLTSLLPPPETVPSTGGLSIPPVDACSIDNKHCVEDRLQPSTAPWSTDRFTMLETVRKQGKKPLGGSTLHWRSMSPARADSPVVRVWCRHPSTAGVAVSLHKVAGSHWRALPPVIMTTTAAHLDGWT